MTYPQPQAAICISFSVTTVRFKSPIRTYRMVPTHSSTCLCRLSKTRKHRTSLPRHQSRATRRRRGLPPKTNLHDSERSCLKKNLGGSLSLSLSLSLPPPALGETRRSCASCEWMGSYPSPSEMEQLSTRRTGSPGVSETSLDGGRAEETPLKSSLSLRRREREKERERKREDARGVAARATRVKQETQNSAYARSAQSSLSSLAQSSLS